MGKLFYLAILLLIWAPGTLLAKDWDPRLSQASTLAYEGKIAAAQTLIDAYLQEHPDDPNGLFIKAVVLDWKAAYEGEEPAAANQRILEIYEQANTMAFHLWEKDPKNVDRLIDFGNSYLFLGRKQSDLGQWFKAVLTSKKSQKHMEAALGKEPDRVDALFAFGAFHYLADNAPPAAAAFKSLLGIKGTKAQGLAEMRKAMFPTHPYYNDARYVWVFIQMDYEKNFPEALQMVETLAKEFPDNPEIQRRRAQIMEKQDKAKGLEQYLAFAAWCEAQGTLCHRNYLFLAAFDTGRIAKDLGQNDRAQTYLAKAVQLDTKLDPSLTGKTFLMLGQLKEAEGPTEAAITWYDQAKAVPKLPKAVKKAVEKSLEAACKRQNIPGKC